MVGSGWHLLAAESGPAVHIKPAVLFEISGWQITNSILFAWVGSLLMLIIFLSVARVIKLRPKGGFSQIVEVGNEFIFNLLNGSLGSHAKALKYAPYFTTIFFFIAFSNFIGLLPGVGEALTYKGQPVFRAYTADLNGTLATALVALGLVQYFAIKESGITRHLRHYFGGKLWNPLTYLVGFYEVFGEIIRLFSLALRLFLNIAIGEIIIAVFSYLGKFAAPVTALPFLLLELGVCILQAYIFVMLCSTYLAIAIAHNHDDSVEINQPATEIVNIKGSSKHDS